MLNFSSNDTSKLLRYAYHGENTNQAYTSLKNYYILNMPFQWNQLTDPRFSYNQSSKIDKVFKNNNYGQFTGSRYSIGRTYDKNIIKNCPVVIIRAGKPVFSGGNRRMDEISNQLSESYEDQFGEAIIQLGDTHNKGYNLDKSDNPNLVLLNENRWYDFRRAHVSYVAHVKNIIDLFAYSLSYLDKNFLNFATKSFTYAFADMGSESKTDADEYSYQYPNKKLETSGKGLGSIFRRDFIALYLDGSSTFSESFATSTTESQVVGKIKGFSQMAREFNFLSGGMLQGDSGIGNFVKDMSDSITSAFGMLDGNSVNNFVNATLSAANMIFPEIWNESNYSKDMTLNFKLFSPYGDPYSVFENIFIPFSFLLGLALPIQTTRAGYSSPFILKAYSRGLFNTDLGIVTGLNITRGESSTFTKDGLPTELEVSMTIKDLFPVLTMAITTKDTIMGNETSLIEYVEALSGVELYSGDRIAHDMLVKNYFSKFAKGESFGSKLKAWIRPNEGFYKNLLTNKAAIDLAAFFDTIN